MNSTTRTIPAPSLPPRGAMPRLAAAFPRSAAGLLALAGALFLAPSASAHNLDTIATSVTFAPDYLQLMSTRATASQPLVQAGDEFWVILKTTPGPGTDTGVGGYQTFYVPDGVEVLDAAYVLPDPSVPEGFVKIPMKGQSPIAIGNGSIASATTPGLIGFELPGTNGLGFKTNPVTATGLHRGTLAGVYADTGIFYSTDPRTVFNSYGTVKPPPLGPPFPMKNNSGDTVGEYYAANVLNSSNRNVLGVMTLWDSYQLRAYGRADVTPLLDPNGRGNAPWGLANVVAGPQSGYAWEFDFATYESTPGTVADKQKAAIKIGPWNRIQYPGSQISQDQPGLVSNVLGYAGIDASLMGIAPTAIPTDANAIRFALGQLQIGRPEFSAVKIKLTSAPDPDSCWAMYMDAFGGDAGGFDNGKDHIWRYFDPTVVTLNPCVFLQKTVSKALVAPGETFYYDITFANNGTVALPNVTITDTLPSGLVHVSAVPPPNTLASPNFTWNFGTVSPGQIVTIRQYVKATGTGTLFNTATARSNTEVLGIAQQSVEVGVRPILEKFKTVTPSSVAPGQTVTYTMTIENRGTGTSAVPVVITDLLPPGFSYTSLVSANLNGASISSPTITVNSSNTNRPIFTVTQGIQPGKKLVISFSALVGPGVSPGVYWNQFQVVSDGIILPPIPEAPVTVAGGKIGDTIWRDWNGNGTQDAGEPGITGVTVQLYQADGTTLITSTTTDANGKYYFPGLVAGTYVVKVVPPAGTVQTGDPDGTMDNQHTVVLATDQQYLTADFGYKPTGAASIGDRVFEDVANNGVFNSGTDTGIPGVIVSLYADNNNNGVLDPGTDTLLGTTTTDGTGLYSFTGLAPGFNYLASVNPADGGLATYFGVDPFQSSTANPQVVTNLTGSYLDADFGFWRVQPSSIGDTVFIDADGNGLFDPLVDIPLGGVTVTLRLDGNAIATTETGPGGTYLFPNLGVGDYTVTVDTADPQIPADVFPRVVNIDVTLGAGQNYLDADFPFLPGLSKSSSPFYVPPGSNITFTLRPKFPGNEPLENVRLFDPLPIGTTYVAASANAGGTFGAYTPIAAEEGNDPEGGPLGTTTLITTVTTDASFITPGSNITVTVNVRQDSGSTVANVAPEDFELFGAPYTIISGPTPATQSVPTGAIGASFTYVVRIDGPGEFRASSGAQNDTATYSWPSGSSATVLAATHGGPNVVTWNFGSTTQRVPAETVVSGSPAGIFGLRGDNSAVFARYGITSGGWTTRSNFPSGNVNWGGSLATDGVQTIFALRGGGTQNFASYDVVSNTWTARANTGANMTEGGALVYHGGYVYATVGKSTAFRRWQVVAAPAAGTWEARAALPANVGKGGALTTDGTYIYALSGDAGAGNKRKLRRYDPVANTWSTLADIPADLGEGAALVRLGGHLYALRGKDTKNYYRYDIAANTWLKRKDAPDKVKAGGALTTDGTYIYAFQGKDKNKFWRYNPANDTWAVLSNYVGTVNPGGALVYVPNAAVNGRLNVMAASPRLVTNGDPITVTMTLTSTSAVNNIVPGAVTVSPVGTATPVGGWTLVSADDDISGPGDSVVFTRQYTANPGASIANTTFAASATGDGPTAFGSATTASVIGSPVLTFQATVQAGAPPVIYNAGIFSETGGVFGSYVSNTTENSTSGSIGDRVWLDADLDGVQDLGETGLAGVRVYIDSNNNGQFDTGEPSAITSTIGTYHLYGLAAGTYPVRIDASTYPAGYFPTTTVLHTVNLATNQQYMDADFGLAPLPPGTSSIGDFVWLDGNGDGVQDAGEPGLENVTVNLERLINGNWVQIASDVTDAAGAYSFTGLSAADYRIKVDPNSQISSPYAPGTFALGDVTVQTYDLDGLGTANQAQISLPAATAVTTVDFGYNWTGSIGDLVWWDYNTNGLQDEVPLVGIPNARVQLYFDFDGNGVLDVLAGDYEITRVFTDANGFYQFTGLPPGNYIVEVYEDSFVVDGIRNVVPTTNEFLPVVLAPGSMTTDTADFGYFVGARVEALIFHDINGDGVRALTEPLLPGITITLTGTDNFGNPVTQTALSDATGYVAFLVPAGNYTISYNTSEAATLFPALTLPTTLTSFDFEAFAGEDGIRFFDFGLDNNGKIGDTIFGDLDGTSGAGVGPGAGDVGLAGVTVNLYLDIDGNGVIDFGAGDLLLAVTSTDANGLYTFGGLADTTGSQQYMVQVVTGTLPGGYQTTASSYPTGAIPATSRYSTTLTGGAAINIVDFGYPLVPAVYYSVSGNVYNDNGAGGGTSANGVKDGAEPGLAPVTVLVQVDENNDSVFEITYTLTTDANGNYSVGGILQGSDVRITVVNSTLPSAAFVQTGDPNGPPLSNVYNITNLQADATNLNFGYLEQFGSLSGTVVVGSGNGIAEPGEPPVAGVSVTLQWFGPDGIPDTLDDVFYNTTTDAAGFYSFGGLQPGGYRVNTTVPAGYLTLADRDGGNPNSIAATLAVGQNLATRDFEYQNASISGIVWTDSNANGVLDGGEPGLPNVLVFLDLDDNGSLDAGEPSVLTDINGAYQFVPLVAGSYPVRIDPSTLPAGSIASYDYDGLGTLNLATVGLALNQQLANVNFGYYQPASIAGTVRADTTGDTNGDTPLAGVTVQLLDGDGNVVASTTTDASGNYSFTGLVPGQYTVREIDPTGFISLTPNDVPVTLSSGDVITGIDFVDTQLGSIAGFVLADTDNNGSGDAPIAGVTLTLKDSDGNTVATTTTNASGAYLFADVAPGSYSVVQTQPAGYASVSDVDGGNLDINGDVTPIVVLPGAAVTGQNFVEVQLGSISGTVQADTDGNGTGDSPLAGVTVTLKDGDGNVVATTTTDASGNYSFGDLLPGDYTVEQTDLAGYISLTPNTVPVTVPPGGNATADFVDTQLGSIAGTVLIDTNGDNAGDAPQAGVVVTLKDSDGNVVATTTTDAVGNYVFTNVAPGTYTVTQTVPGGYTAVDDVDGGDLAINGDVSPISVLPAQNVTGQDFVNQQTGALISGFVLADTDNNGSGDAPIAGVTLTLKDSDGNTVATTTTNAGGFYVFADVAPGTYTVVETQPAGYASVSDVDGGNLDINGDVTPIVVLPGAAVTGQNFVEVQLGSVSGTVQADTNGDNTGDVPLSGVTVTLKDGDGNVVATTTTDAGGNYSFGGLLPGNYTVEQTDLPGYVSVTPNTVPVVVPPGGNAVADFVDRQVFSISGTVYEDVNGLTDGTVNGFPTNVNDQLYANLLDEDGIVVATTPVAVNGTYTFGGVVPGNYTVQLTVNEGVVGQPAPATALPVGYTNTGENLGAGAGNDGTVDGLLAVTVTNADVTNANFGIKKFCEVTWLDWQEKYPLDGANEPMQNPDTDVYSNLLEYAFCLDPESGLQEKPPFCVMEDEDTGNVDAFMVKPCGILDVTYTLYVIDNLANAPGGWTEVTSILPVPAGCDPDTGKQMVKWPGLNTLPGLANGGFAIIKVELDIDGDDVVDHTDFTEVCGWTDTVLSRSCRSYSNPFVNHEIFTGVVDGVSGQVLDVTTAANGVDFAALAGDGRQYYIEVLEGPLEGHRFDVNVAGSGLNTIALKPDADIYAGPIYNTLSSVAGLAGNQIALRAHRTAAQVFPPELFAPGDDAAEADNILIWNGTSYNVLWIPNVGGNPYWTITGDPGLPNLDLLPVPSGMGISVYRKALGPNANVTVRAIGGVRENKFALPLPKGLYFTSSAYPVDQSPNGPQTRDMFHTSGFTGNGAASRADQFSLWQADEDPTKTGLTTYWYVKTATRNYWTTFGDASLPNRNAVLLFKKDRSAFHTTVNPIPGYIIPPPWAAAP